MAGRSRRNLLPYAALSRRPGSAALRPWSMVFTKATILSACLGDVSPLGAAASRLRAAAGVSSDLTGGLKAPCPKPKLPKTEAGHCRNFLSVRVPSEFAGTTSAFFRVATGGPEQLRKKLLEAPQSRSCAPRAPPALTNTTPRRQIAVVVAHGGTDACRRADGRSWPYLEPRSAGTADGRRRPRGGVGRGASDRVEY